MTETAVSSGTLAPAAATPWYKLLYVQVLVAIVAGVLLGHFNPELAQQMKPLGDGFIKLIKMVIGPIIFGTVVLGIASMRDLGQVGRVGVKALVYFEVVTTLALIIGLVVAHAFQPGVGMNIDPASLDTKGIETYVSKAKEQSTIEFLLNIIPTSPVSAFAEGSILQILFFAILFAFGLQALGEKGDGLLSLIDQATKVMFKIVGYIMVLAPIGAFGAMAFTIGKYGLASLIPLAKLMGVFYLTCVIFIAFVLGTVARAAGFSLWKLIRYIREELFIVLGTCSSETVLPRIMVKLEKLGCEKQVVGLVVPAGYSFNLDGTCIYLTLASIFLAQATNTPLTWGQELGLLGVLLLTSKGAAGVVGSGFIVQAATLASTGVIPVAAMAIILGVDRFMSEARAVTNLIGNSVATIAVANWDGALDKEKLRAELDRTA
jgi:aerobic C4-dicarboxylate transport protein